MKLLLLAGTSEARRLAERLADDPRVSTVASLAGATRDPAPLPVALRTGGFGGEAQQEKWIEDNEIESVIDATHPFAERISRRSQAICARHNLPYLQLLRPGWQAQPGDRWTYVDDAAAAARGLPAGARVFLATGRQSLDAFAGRGDVTLFLRVIDPPDAAFPLANGRYVIGRPPFSVADEVRLFKELSVDLLVTKDAGGQAGAKLEAARALDLPVVMIARPKPPPGDKAANVEAALDWLEQLL